MSVETEQGKPVKGGSTMIEWPAPIYQRLQEEARALTEMEGRRVTVTELVRRRALSRDLPSAA